MDGKMERVGCWQGSTTSSDAIAYCVKKDVFKNGEKIDNFKEN